MDITMDINLVEEYMDIYGVMPERAFFAPGRVNLIGEHTDYNGGHVFPCAISMGIFCVVSKRKDNLFSLYSMSFPNRPAFEIKFTPDSDVSNYPDWTQYPLGMINEVYKKFGEYPFGLNIFFYSNLPLGSGLSSSAALEIATGLMLKEVYELKAFAPIDIVKTAHTVENVYVGNKCGIMDQYASCMGEKNTALFLDTATLECKKVPVSLTDYSLVLVNSNVPHNLVASEYNLRRRQCEEALAILQKHLSINSLCEITDMDVLNKYRDDFKDETIFRRARHAIAENIRTIEAVKAFEDNNLEEFGRLMRASHESLRDDYEVSCEEMDFLASFAWNFDGVIGARMTGGGFGGCTVNIVKNTRVEEFRKEITMAYFFKTGYSAKIYTTLLGHGAHERSL